MKRPRNIKEQRNKMDEVTEGTKEQKGRRNRRDKGTEWTKDIRDRALFQ